MPKYVQRITKYYRNTIIQGKNKFYLYFDMQLINGEIKGIGKEYNENGKLIFVGEFREGYRYEGKEFNENGKLIFNGQYSKGIPFNGKKKDSLTRKKESFVLK